MLIGDGGAGQASQSLRTKPVRPALRVCRAIERIEALSAYSQHSCASPAESRRLGLQAQKVGGATAILTKNSANLYFNRLIALGQSAPATPEQIDGFIQSARDLRVKAVGIGVGPSTRPQELATWLKSRGFVRGHPTAKLWRDDAPLARTTGSRGVRVRRVRPAEASLWVDVVSQVWRTFGSRRPWYEARIGTPDWYHFIAWVGDEPVGAAALFVGRVGPTTVGHLVDGVTLGPWRRRGAQSAIIRKRVSEGRRLGCELFTSETAPPLPRMPLVSFRNLRRQGFEMAYMRDDWRLELG